MQTIRTFVAVELPADVRKSAAKLIAQLATAGVDVRWVDPENMHVTLKFLGDVPETETPEVCAAVERACRSCEPFQVELAGAGAFPVPERPRTIWIGMCDPEQQINVLQAAVERELVDLGYKEENRGYRAHLTIGRVKRGGRGTQQLVSLLQEHADYHAGHAMVDEAVVFASQLDRRGPRYSVLSTAELGG